MATLGERHEARQELLALDLERELAVRVRQRDLRAGADARARDASRPRSRAPRRARGLRSARPLEHEEQRALRRRGQCFDARHVARRGELQRRVLDERHVREAPLPVGIAARAPCARQREVEQDPELRTEVLRDVQADLDALERCAGLVDAAAEVQARRDQQARLVRGRDARRAGEHRRPARVDRDDRVRAGGPFELEAPVSGTLTEFVRNLVRFPSQAHVRDAASGEVEHAAAQRRGLHADRDARRRSGGRATLRAFATPVSRVGWS
ncbi:MAG: hypothetical protein IPJ19_20985 [Planctomycetes bacterium]|nr:hypothetical protein [Planctomycetota bacterium]